MKAYEILANHRLKRTSCREGIIDVFLSTKMALSENDICERLAGHYDRTTFYRSFKTLVEKNILHKIIIDNKNVRYALNDIHNHKIKHVHFYCNQCNMVECLEAVNFEPPKLPNGYSIIDSDLIIKGICNKCKTD